MSDLEEYHEQINEVKGSLEYWREVAEMHLEQARLLRVLNGRLKADLAGERAFRERVVEELALEVLLSEPPITERLLKVAQELGIRPEVEDRLAELRKAP